MSDNVADGLNRAIGVLDELAVYTIVVCAIIALTPVLALRRWLHRVRER